MNPTKNLEARIQTALQAAFDRGVWQPSSLRVIVRLELAMVGLQPRGKFYVFVWASGGARIEFPEGLERIPQPGTVIEAAERFIRRA